jgi:K+-sensing histidine kinase KdpD
MSVGAAIRITSSGEERVIAHATAFAREFHEGCYIISIVPHLPYGATTDEETAAASRNLELIAAASATPLMQEGDDVPDALVAVARSFGITTLFLQSGAANGLDRSTAERLLYLRPSFDLIVLPPE